MYASAGVLAVEARHSTFVVPPERAVWIPAATPHRLSARTRARLRTLYFDPVVAAGRDAVTVVPVSPLLRELIVYVVAAGMLDARVPEDVRLAHVVLDQIRDIDVVPLEIAEPNDELARAAAQLLRDDPSVELDAVARAIGTTRRTLERRFLASSGSSLGRWRQRVQLARALELLALGTSVTEAGAAVGYSTTSAFIDAFRRALGATPARYFKEG